MPLIKIDQHRHYHMAPASTEEHLIHNERVKLWANFCMNVGYVTITAFIVALASAIATMVSQEALGATSTLWWLALLLTVGGSSFLGLALWILRRLRVG